MDRSGKCQRHQSHSSQQGLASFRGRPMAMANYYKENNNSDTKELAQERPKKNEFCLPSEEELKRRKELYAEFDRIGRLTDETNNWLASKSFEVSYWDRRNLSNLMKTCFNPVNFSSIGKKPKKLVIVRHEKEIPVPKAIKLSESERFRHLDTTGTVSNALKEYIKARNKKLS